MFGEYLLMYFTNHDGNSFLPQYFSILPKCTQVKKGDYEWAIILLARKIVRSDEKIRYYANLAWMHSKLPCSLTTYENTLKYVNSPTNFL